MAITVDVLVAGHQWWDKNHFGTVDGVCRWEQELKLETFTLVYGTGRTGDIGRHFGKAIFTSINMRKFNWRFVKLLFQGRKQ